MIDPIWPSNLKAFESIGAKINLFVLYDVHKKTKNPILLITGHIIEHVEEKLCGLR